MKNEKLSKKFVVESESESRRWIDRQKQIVTDEELFWDNKEWRKSEIYIF